MGSQLKVDSRGYETKPHGSHDFPITTGKVRISGYENRRFCPHWHQDPEITVILDGEINYQVNDKIYHLRKGQGIFVNSNCLHSGWNENGECIYLPMNFDPYMLFGYNDSRIYRKYVENIINSPALVCLLFDSGANENNNRIIELFKEIYNAYCEKAPCYELHIFSLFCEAWYLIAPQAIKQIEEAGGTRVTKQVSRMKNAIDYVEHNYAELISLSDLASVCGLSRSELCRCFKNIMRQSPMEYVTSVRVRKSLPLLTSNEYSITQIAELCGFSGSSYFSEMFKRYMFCTPSQYIKKVNEGS